MNIFLDTNIFLEVLLKRKEFENALRILNAIERGLFKGFVLDITLLNIDYIVRKQQKNTKNFLEKIQQNFRVIGANNDFFSEAFVLENNDLEDSIQYISAKNNHCEVIVSNDKNFYKGDIAVLSALEFNLKFNLKFLK